MALANMENDIHIAHVLQGVWLEIKKERAMKTKIRWFFTLVLFLGMQCGAPHVFAADDTQYLGVFVGSIGSELYFKEGLPDTYNQEGFNEVVNKVGTKGTEKRKLALFFSFNIFRQSLDKGIGIWPGGSLSNLLGEDFGFTVGGDYDTPAMKKALENTLAASLATDVPVIIRLDGKEWWELRPDLWNWWNENEVGYNPGNINNVERFDWGTGADTAVKIGWRDWGAQMRVPPAPNLASLAYRAAQKECLDLLLLTIVEWYKSLPDDKKYLFGGLMLGWEVSTYLNSYYYNDGNSYLAFHRNDGKDPQNGPLSSMPLGYAAAQTLKERGVDIQTSGRITEATGDAICADYLDFLIGLAVNHGIPANRIITHGITHVETQWHGGGLSGKGAVSSIPGVIPGWSWQGLSRGNPLSHVDRLIDYAEGGPWSLSETASGISDHSGSPSGVGVYKTVAEVQERLEEVLAYKNNRYIIFVNWGGQSPGQNYGVKYQPILLEAIKRALLGSQVKLGMWYFPGWKETTTTSWVSSTWPRTKVFPEKEPLLGWYDNSEVAVVNQHLEWIAKHGINFVAFAWYEDGRDWSQMEATILAYHQAEARYLVDYALLWANHFSYPTTRDQWDGIVDKWIDNHFLDGAAPRKEYLKIDGKPVVFIFEPNSGDSHPGLVWQANAIRNNMGAGASFTVVDMLNRARDRAKSKGLDGIYFVLCVPANRHWVDSFGKGAGAYASAVDALTAYNYHWGGEDSGSSNTDVGGYDFGQQPLSYSFAQLDRGYQRQWDWILGNNLDIPYFVPMTSGWDERPRRARIDWDAHQKSASTPQSFEAHLRAGYDRIVRDTNKTKGIGMLCCWSEYEEGSVIEPSKRHGTEYLQRIRKVFSGK
ncbi:MAG: glycoside hydrolase family 99-like domain-containing protein [Burkholderiales bacterium]|jgi:hypothetical protein|nr:glycoside hydrolase family 99-like domain-containing protein [Burkholderiales bacterium]